VADLRSSVPLIVLVIARGGAIARCGAKFGSYPIQILSIQIQFQNRDRMHGLEDTAILSFNKKERMKEKE
jgi:hypothetical protein